MKKNHLMQRSKLKLKRIEFINYIRSVEKIDT